MAIFTDEVQQQLIDFLSTKLCFNGELYSHYYDDDYCEDEDWYDDIKDQCEADYIEHGASKIVLFYDEIPQWVVKLPLLGEYYEEADSFRYFDGVDRTYPTAEDDYCAAEAYLSQEAEKRGIGDMFAKTYYLFNCDGVAVYVSEKMSFDFYSQYNFRDKVHSTSLAIDVHNSFGSIMDSSAFARFFDAYDELKVYDLIAFIEDYAIYDLHNCNMGYDENWNIRLLDYSGFSY